MDNCQKLLNAYKIIRELRSVEKDERQHLDNAVDDLRVILQVGSYGWIISCEKLEDSVCVSILSCFSI